MTLLRLITLTALSPALVFACGDGGEFSSRGGDTSEGGAGGVVVAGDGDGDGDEAPGGQGGQSVVCSCALDEYCTPEGQCVDCLRDAHCEGETRVCDRSSGTCVGCLDSSDCTSPEEPICFGDTQLCEPCDGDASCGALGNRCLPTGECVACTPETDDRAADDDDCGAGVCDPVTFSCDVTREQMGKGTCEACVADSECPPDHNCVPMQFQGEPREGGFCLRDSSLGGCSENPYRSPTTNRVSLSGASPRMYCGINEDLTTCEATLDLLNDESCVDAEDCGAEGLEDGLCEVVSLSPAKCTYACDSAAQCRASSPGSGCAGVGGSYCGG